MKVKSTVLYLLGALLLLFGNRDLWQRTLAEWKENRKNSKLQPVELDVHQPFEVQQLVFDEATQKWRNPSLYFHTVRLGKIDFKPGKKNIRIESGEQAENASESS